MNQQAQTQVNIAPGPKPSFVTAQGLLLQRKCNCGGSAGMSGKCEECQEKQLSINRYSTDRRAPSGLLPSRAELARSTMFSDSGAGVQVGHQFGRLRVGDAAPGGTSGERAISQPGDRSEVEADRAAAVVMRALSSPVFEEKQESPALSQSSPLIQREVADESASETEAAPETSTEPETAALGETPASGLIVEDDASEVGPGQMRKSDFLAQLNAEVYAAADEILVTRGRTAQSCPYITNWFEYGNTRSGSYVETFIRRFTPGSDRVAAASEYIPLAVERLRRALLVWANTGEITGVPESLAGDLPATKQKSAVASIGAQVGAEGETAPTQAATGALQAKAREGGSANDADPRAVQNQLRGGQPLGSGVKARMESAFGYDFSRVRVHHDANAAHLSTNLNARAFTVGSDIAFGAGEYQPGTLVGDAILAHELAHVVQQGGAPASNGPMQKGQARYGALEEDADNAAVGAVVSLWGGAKGKLGEISRNAMPRLKSGLRLQRCQDCMGDRDKSKVEDKTPAPLDAGAAGCDASFAGVTFSLADQTASGAKPAVAFQIGQAGSKFALKATGTAPAKYKPKITINAPSDAKATEYEVGIIQNLLTDRREITFTAGGPILTQMPVPLKDGAPKGSGVEDDVFAENGKGHPGILVGFSTKGDTATLKLPDTPGDFGFINLTDNKECAGSKVNGTMTSMVLKDSFRTWAGVRHKPSKCIKTIHHIDWNIDWSATVDGTVSPPTHNVTGDALNVTTPNGDGKPTFVSGGKVPAELIATVRKCGGGP
jgi:hypothetical protein